MPEAKEIYVIGKTIGRDTKSDHWLYKMHRVPKIGERVKGSEAQGFDDREPSFRVRLVIRERKMVALIDALHALDSVEDQSPGLKEALMDFLIAVAKGKRVY